MSQSEIKPERQLCSKDSLYYVQRVYFFSAAEQKEHAPSLWWMHLGTVSLDCTARASVVEGCLVVKMPLPKELAPKRGDPWGCSYFPLFVFNLFPCCMQMQETPVSKGGTHQYVFFDSIVYLQTATNRLPSNSAIFFEFKHWKEKEKKVIFILMAIHCSPGMALQRCWAPNQYTHASTWHGRTGPIHSCSWRQCMACCITCSEHKFAHYHHEHFFMCPCRKAAKLTAFLRWMSLRTGLQS